MRTLAEQETTWTYGSIKISAECHHSTEAYITIEGGTTDFKSLPMPDDDNDIISVEANCYKVVIRIHFKCVQLKNVGQLTVTRMFSYFA